MVIQLNLLCVMVIHNIKIAFALFEHLVLKGIEFLNTDKNYDSEAFRENIHTCGVHANTSNGHMNWLIYQGRHVVKNTFAS